jgi:uracil-DNA glycosylase
MGTNSGGETSLPNTVAELWENWQQPNGAGPCAQCPRHWSRRSDIPEQGEEPNSYEMNPWFAEGDYDPEVVVIGEEPGHHDPNPENNRLGKLFEQTRDDIRGVANEDSGTLDQAKPLFDTLYENNISTYWTNTAKCNPIGDNNNSDGQAECCGLSGDVVRSYLRDELEELEPRIVISLGGSASKNLLALYDDQLSQFADSTMAGEALSGFHPRTDHTAPFEIATAFPPRYCFNNDEFQSRKPDILNPAYDEKVKKSYYHQYAEDLREWLSGRRDES